MNMEIRTADAIVIVYSVDRFDTFMSIRMKWIPLINQLRGSNVIYYFFWNITLYKIKTHTHTHININ